MERPAPLVTSGAAALRAGGAPGGASPQRERPPALQLSGVAVRHGEFMALDGVTFSLAMGTSLAVVGPNGAGKSTLIKVLLGLTVPLRGEVRVLGGMPGRQPQRIGYVPQLKTFDRTFPATSLELVATGLTRRWPHRVTGEARERAASALASVGAGQLADRPLSRLSGGEMQRVYLARAFVRRPDLVLLDEPATGVDFLAERDIYDLLEEYQGATGATIVTVTHDLTAARYHADCVLLLNRTQRGFGAPADVLHDDSLKVAFGHGRHRHTESEAP